MKKKCSENWDACSAMTISCAGCSVFVTWSTRWMGFLLTFFCCCCCRWYIQHKDHSNHFNVHEIKWIESREKLPIWLNDFSLNYGSFIDSIKVVVAVSLSHVYCTHSLHDACMWGICMHSYWLNHGTCGHIGI